VYDVRGISGNVDSATSVNLFKISSLMCCSVSEKFVFHSAR